MSPARKAVCPVQNRETSAWRPRAERFVLPFSSNLERHHRRVAAIPRCIGHGSLADCGLRSRRWSLGRAHHVDRDCAGCGGTPKLRDLYPRWPQGFRPFSLYHAGWRLPVVPPIRLSVNPRQLPPSTLPRLSISMDPGQPPRCALRRPPIDTLNSEFAGPTGRCLLRNLRRIASSGDPTTSSPWIRINGRA